MNYYFAPMEGITGHIYRRVHGDVFARRINIYAFPGSWDEKKSSGTVKSRISCRKTIRD